MSTPSELERWIAVRQCEGQNVVIVATEDERHALANRFNLVSVDGLRAEIDLSRDGSTVAAKGRLAAEIVQSCAVSGEDLPVTINERLDLVFVKSENDDPFDPDTEIELAEGDLDEIAYGSDRFDLGEAVAQSLGLAIDPYAEGPEAEAIRRKVDLSEPAKDGPFAALGALKKN